MATTTPHIPRSRTLDAPVQEPIAVVGVSALMPGSTDIDGFWRTLVQGRDLVTDVPPTHWLVSDHYDPDPAAQDKTYGYRGAFLDPVDFDPLAYGLPPSALPATDTSQALTLIAAQRLLDDLARYGPPRYDPDRVSVILGTGPMELLTTMANRMQRPVWTMALREAGLPEHQVSAICDRIAESYVPWQEATFPGLLSNVVAGRVANRFDFHGTNFVTDAACAASLAAVSAAINELRLREADMVVTGGVDTLNDAVSFTCFSKTPALSPTGDCRPFSVDSDGMVLGEGIVLFALKRLVDAERDGDAVYAVVRGVGASSDGHGTAIYAPLPEGQLRALRRAYRACGYAPDTVEMLEAHGTGTPTGDATEVAALRQVFGEASRASVPWCALGSVKSQFGHTKCAAGAAGLLKAVLALHHKVLPPTIKVKRPNPRLELTDGPFYVNTVTRPWIRGSAHPRRASVSSFGFGGTNFHVAVEEHVPRDRGRRPFRTRAAPSELVVLAAASPEDLLGSCRTVLADHRPLWLIARESQEKLLPRCVRDRRLAIVAADTEELRRKAERLIARVRSAPEAPVSTPDGMHYGVGPAGEERIAFLFPGQGSQYVGMGADVAMHTPQARLLWDRLADIELDDRPLHRVVFPAPAFSDEERDAQTARLSATEWAQPAVAAHSMALLAVLDALGIRPGCVAGHGLGELTALHAAGVLDGESLLRLARRRGELMRDAAREPGGMLAARRLRDHARHFAFASPKVPVYANSDAAAYPSAPEGIADRIARQLVSAVRFADQVAAMYDAGIRTFIEVGPGSVLTGLVRANLRHRDHTAIALDQQEQNGLTALHDALARLVALGVPVDFAPLWQDHAPASLPAPPKSPATVRLSGTNYGKPYPAATYSAEVLPVMPQPAHGPTQRLPEEDRSPAAGGRATWWETLGEVHRLAAATHTVYNRAMTDAHLAYLSAVDRSLCPNNGPATTDRLAERVTTAGDAVANGVSPNGLRGSTPPAAAPAVPPAPPAPMPPPLNLPDAHQFTADVPEADPFGAVPFSAGDGEVAEPSAPRRDGSATEDLIALALQVVADKTGYPVEILRPEMRLQADLGVDSIKRVEILSALRDQVEDLPALDAGELGRIETIGEIAERLTAKARASAEK